MKRTLKENNSSLNVAPSATADKLKKPKMASQKVAPSTFAMELEEIDTETSVQRWPRAKLSEKDSNPLENDVVLQWVDIDMYVGKPLNAHTNSSRIPEDIPGSREGPVPVIRIYGVTEKGNSVVAHVHGFTPYFYCETPIGYKPEHNGDFRCDLDRLVKQQARGLEKPPVYCVAVLDEEKQSVLGYQHGKYKKFLKVCMALPGLVPTARGILQKGFKCSGYSHKEYMTYESNVPYVLRYMVDNNIVGANWLELKRGTYTKRAPNQHVSTCQLEVDVVFEDVISHPTSVPRFLKIAPLRILSFDIECMGRRGVFPDPKIDPVIQIANFVTVQGDKTAIIRNVFVLDTCLPIVGAEVLSFKTEQELLLKWSQFVRECDPDILTGYNIQNFDIKYLMERAAALGIKQFPYLGRIANTPSRMKQNTFSSSAYGTRENTDTSMEGRVMMDMIAYMYRNHKLSSYSLNAVSAEFLGQQKEDVHHSIISDLQRGTSEDRRRLAVYCLKDAYLPQQLMDKLLVLVNYVEMARVTGVPIPYLFSRGQQIKVVSMLLRKAMQHRLIIPNLPKQGGGGGDVGYEGATVIEPIKGYYQDPIATLDFASLYPSIMMAHNLCYTTLLSRDDTQKLSKDEYVETPTGHCFVNETKQKGLLPTILDELLSARKRAKKDMKAATDPLEKAVMNGRQLALKISANSVYGFTGATVGQLPCIPISASVTAYGRKMIDDTKREVEKEYTIANGYPADAVVIYGDTDSVMVKFGVKDVKTAMKMGLEAAEKVTKTLFKKPIALEFEKIYYPYLLMNKKRYAGLYWTNPDKYDKMDAKGIETVRRDCCGLVRIMMKTCLRKILIDRSVEDAIKYTKYTISSLLQNKVDISLLIITKSLSGKSEDYANKQAHVELAARMHARDAGSAPVVGDRVPYVMIKAAKGAPGYLKSEDPIYVLENNIPIDFQWYLQNQLSKPLSRLFEAIIPNTNVLFRGDHTRAVYKATPSTSIGIMKFAVKTLKCVGCKASLPKGVKTLCKHCAPKSGEIYLEKIGKANNLEERFSKLWTQCQRCQGSLHQDIICTSKDCPIFYMRKKVQKDIKENETIMDRFSDW